MITEFLIQLGLSIAGWIPSWFPVLDLPDVTNGAAGSVGHVMGLLVGVGVWVNWVAIIAAMGAVGAWWAGFGLSKLAREAAKHIPLFGGGG